MKIHNRLMLAAVLPFLLGSVCRAATVAGTVKGTDGAPFQGAFVEAQNVKTKINVIVLSDLRGQYRIENLPAGEYRLQIRAVGFKADPIAGVSLAADKNASYDFALQQGMVHWNDISMYQAKKLLPAAKGKDLIVARCGSCHLFQTRMASVTRDLDGWKDRLQYMRKVLHVSVSEQDADEISSYLATVFGPDSELPKSPTEMPEYKATLRPLDSDGLKLVYVEYDMPGPTRMPFSAAPDKEGNIWIPNFGVANKITRLDPKTGAMQDFSVPNLDSAMIHSAVPAPNGTVWLAETDSNRLGEWNPATQKITEYQDAFIPGKEGMPGAGGKHTVRIDPSGNVWCSGAPLTKFDPETKKFTRFEEVPNAYDVKPDKNGDVWFTTGSGANKIGKVDGKTMKVTQWSMPAPKSFPRRMEIGADGMIWVGEFSGGKMARFDPATQTFKEYPLPGGDPSPYSMGFDADGYLWYDSHHMDTLNRFDTKTGKVAEFPAPHSEIAMREFFRDAQGRMWYGTNPNNKVGYFYLAK